MMFGGMIGSRAPSALPNDQLTVLYALMTLLDPDAGPQIERIAASLGREDVRRALEGLHECIALITALSPLEDSVAAAIEDLQAREAALRERESKLVKRENAISSVLAALE